MNTQYIINMITTILISLSITAAGYWSTERTVEIERQKMEQARQQGHNWMQDTTARLEAITEGIERITGDTVELAARLEAMEAQQ